MTLLGWVGVREPWGRLGGRGCKKRHNLSDPGLHHTGRCACVGGLCLVVVVSRERPK